MARIGDGEHGFSGAIGVSESTLYLLSDTNELKVDCVTFERFTPSQFEQTQEKERSVLADSSLMSCPMDSQCMWNQILFGVLEISDIFLGGEW